MCRCAGKSTRNVLNVDHVLVFLLRIESTASFLLGVFESGRDSDGWFLLGILSRLNRLHAHRRRAGRSSGTQRGWPNWLGKVDGK
jgi:hypothetical protein